MQDVNRSPLAFIVEDEPDVSALLRSLLEGEGWDTVIASSLLSAQRAMAQLRRAPALIVLDQRLPDGRGLSLVLGLRRRFPDARIFLVTGTRGLTRELEGNLVDAVFHKPLELNRFLAEVQIAGGSVVR
jgi:two-component system OmpR family response regulator